MKLIKEGVAKTIPAHLEAEYKAQGWRPVGNIVVDPGIIGEPGPVGEAGMPEKPKPKSRSKKEA